MSTDYPTGFIAQTEQQAEQQAALLRSGQLAAPGIAHPANPLSPARLAKTR